MKENIELWSEDEMWIIKHSPSGITTQGNSRIHALLMLADALYGHKGLDGEIEINEDRELLSLAEDVFVLSEEQREFADSLREQ